MRAQDHQHGANGAATVEPARVVLHVGGLHYATENTVVERKLGAQRGVLAVDANPVAQTATVSFDPERTSVESLRRWVEECGYHCAGRSVPGHVCDPLAAEEPLAPAPDHAAVERADEAHGHGGHAGMSMQQMVRDMRNRFPVALLFAIPIGTGWLYSLAATFWIGGDVFYEASAFLATFVLLGHWFEMRARGGANDAIRALLDLAPPKAVVIR